MTGHPLVDGGDHEDATRLAAEAARLLLAVRRELDRPGADPAAVGREGDRRSHELLAAALAARHPDDAVVSEEAPPTPGAPGSGRTWVVDPLDGTREFAETGSTDWAVHVALVVEGQPVAGAVALPARDLVLSTVPAPPPPPPGGEVLRLLVSRSRPPAFVAPLAAALGAEVIPMGSAGAKAMAVVLGEADAYVHAGGQHEWDSAAPVAVAVAAGLHTSRLDGSPLVYGTPGAWLPDLVVCRPEVAGPLLAALEASL
ncbi:MAG TPA: inositol monophosphatase family protein [Acidimicrobiales bacterium]|nr:inositol monophosphatase family protein [Acidimicrobiales bacterium]